MTTKNRPTRVLVLHHDPLIATGIGAALQVAPGIEIVAPSNSSQPPDADVAVCDYDAGMTLAKQRKMAGATTRRIPSVVIITWRDSEADVRGAVQSGVGAYLLGSCGLHELVEAVRAAERGSPYLCQLAAMRIANSLACTPLTAREKEILQLMASGMPNMLIASELCIALGTVKAHAKAILDKLHADSRTHATVIAAQRGLLDLQSPLRPSWMHARRPGSISRNATLAVRN